MLIRSRNDERGNHEIGRNERRHFSLCVVSGFQSQFPPRPPSVSRQAAPRYGTAGSERPTPFFGNICLSWLLSVCHHSSLSEPSASSNGEKIGRGGRKEGDGKRRKRLHPMVFGGLSLPTMRRKKKNPCKAAHGEACFLSSPNGSADGLDLSRHTHRLTD